MSMSKKEELYDLVNLIVDDGIRDFTEHMLDVAPASFWTAKASLNHHPEDERGNEGNLIHTIRVAKLVCIMAEGCNLTSIELDVLLSAAILHDPCRYGKDGTEEYTNPEHPQLVRELAVHYSIGCEYSVDIFTLIERHMGKWGKVPYNPEVTPSALLHLADMVSANAEQVWPIGEEPKASWVGATPFKEVGMTQDKIELMKELAEDSEYWASALKFFNSVASRKLTSLTVRQRDWLFSIEASLSDELNKMAAKEVFDD